MHPFGNQPHALLERDGHEAGWEVSRHVRLCLPFPRGWRTVTCSGHRWGIGVSPAPLSGESANVSLSHHRLAGSAELLHALTALYGNEDGVEIRFDQRHGQPRTGMGDELDRRSPPSPDTDLQDHGFIVIPRP